MAFSCENLCRSCMEVTQSGSVILFNKKKKRKTQICLNYEEICNLKVKENDQMPQQLCMSCVSDLNKSYAFRERCIRTYKTLCAYLELSEDEEEPENATQSIILQESPSCSKELPKIDETYEEIEVTDALLDAAKAKVNEGTEGVILEMGEIQTILNSQSGSRNVEKAEGEDDDGLVFIIQNVASNNDHINPQQSPEKSVSSYKCDLCELTFVRKKNFDNHVRRFHEDDGNNEGPVEKRIRLKLMKDDKEDSQAVKEKIQQNPDSKSCKMCGALYMNEKSLKLHERRNACQQTCYSCTQCSKVFTDQQLFREHTENHPQDNIKDEAEKPVEIDPAKKYHCYYENCGKSFKMMSTLKDHLRTHSNEKPFVCNICNRGFSQNTNLKQHLRRHTQIKPFKCTYEGCSSSFVSKGELDSHSRKHSGDHPFKCETCDAKFTTSSSLVKHRRIHSGEKPYVCEFCPVRFTALGTLKNHIKTHTGEKPYKCKFCDRAFTQKSDMAAHERTHTGSRPFVCNICNSSFHQSGTLKTHMKIHGQMEDETVEQSS